QDETGSCGRGFECHGFHDSSSEGLNGGRDGRGREQTRRIDGRTNERQWQARGRMLRNQRRPYPRGECNTASPKSPGQHLPPPRRGQRARPRAFGTAEVAGRVLSRPALNTAKNENRPIAFGESTHFHIQNRAEVTPAGVDCSRGFGHGADLPLPALSPDAEGS